MIDNGPVPLPGPGLGLCPSCGTPRSQCPAGLAVARGESPNYHSRCCQRCRNHTEQDRPPGKTGFRKRHRRPGFEMEDR